MSRLQRTRSPQKGRISRKPTGGGRSSTKRSGHGTGRTSSAQHSFWSRAGGFRFLLSPKILIVAVVAYALFEGLLSNHSFIKLRSFRQERDNVRQELAQAEAKRAEYKEWLDRLDNDPYFVEKMARERLGLVRKGEIVYRYEEPPSERLDQGPLTPPIIDEAETETEP